MVFSKKLTIFAGVNGAGKSTFYNLISLPNLGIRLNSDEIVKNNNDAWQDMRAQIKAGKMLIDEQNKCFNKGLSFNRETTLAGESIINSIKKANALGYQITLYYISVKNPEIAKKRVKKRIEKGGHGVSESAIEKRFLSSHKNLIRILPYCDNAFFYDNSGKSFINLGYYINKKITIRISKKWLKNIEKELSVKKPT
ncbi:MAG: zeta toxin family protein [Clostridia bacterium]|nr:zeta toxin family protein [Clostridia bacterium]